MFYYIFTVFFSHKIWVIIRFNQNVTYNLLREIYFKKLQKNQINMKLARFNIQKYYKIGKI